MPQWTPSLRGPGGEEKKKKNVLLNATQQSKSEAIVTRLFATVAATACVQLLYVLKKSLKVVRFAA